MQIYISRNGEQFGPYTEEQAREYLASGQLTAEDLAWQEGQTEWVALTTLLPQPEAPAQTGGLQFTPAQETATARSNVTYRVQTIEPARPPARNYNWIWGVAFLLAIGLYGASPYISYANFRAAMKSGNKADLEAHIDFPSVRESMKEQIKEGMRAEFEKNKAVKDKEAAMKSGMEMVEKILDMAITSQGLSDVIKERKGGKSPSLGKNGNNSWMADDSLEWSKVEHAFFASPVQFLVRVEKTKLRFYFTGLGWKLKKLESEYNLAGTP